MNTTELFSLGEIYVSDFVKPGTDHTTLPKHELKLVMDKDIGAARLATTMPLDNLFGKYWYLSGTNDSMKRDLRNIVECILPLVPHKDGDAWLDIAANDGTLLSYVDKTWTKIGVDPAEDRIAELAYPHCHYHFQDYFTKQVVDQLNVQAKIVTTVAMFYDLNDPDEFVKDVYNAMDDEGLWVIQLSYTPLMWIQNAFDNILSEHVYYHTFGSMNRILSRNGFEVVDACLNDVNGGSLRLYVRKLIAKDENFASQPYRDVCQFRVKQFLHYGGGPDDQEWSKFHRRIMKLKAQVMDFITREKARGKMIMGYGASTKGNTLLQWFGLDNTMITAIAEKQQAKWGLETVGTKIPIISEEEMRKAQPDYLLMLPWQFVNEFTERESDYLKAGGKFIVPMPKFKIISA